MAKNDKILVDYILEERKSINYPSNDIGEVMELFANEQIMKDYDLSQTDFQQSNIDGKDDGGIDSFYIFVNGILVKKDETFKLPRTQIEITIVIVQCKHADTFEQSPVNSLYTSVSELFDLSKDNNQLDGDYNKDVFSKRDLFRTTYQNTACNLSSLNFKFYYASRGDTDLLGDNILARAEQIKTKMSELFSQCKCSFDFYGASELLALYRKQNSRDLSLPITSSVSTVNECYVALCNIYDYFKFITDENGELKRFIFDSNVRDYMGLNHVNTDILDTLKNQKHIEFWWLNNGITILASSAVNVGKELSIKNVQIVNGLQTSYSIYEYFKSNKEGVGENRNLLIKVVSSEVDTTRDRIIQATNNQTPVELKSLFATDKIQQDIEESLKSYGLFYERRVNYYLNQGCERDKIYDMMYLAGGSICLLLKSPENASNLKQKIFKDSDKYNAIFNPKFDIKVWPIMALLLRKIDTTLIHSNSFQRMTGSTDKRLKKARYLIALIITGRVFQTYTFSSTTLSSLDLKLIDDEIILEAWEICATVISRKNKHLSREKVLTALRKAAEKWGIHGMDFLEHVQNKMLSKKVNDKEISQTVLDSVKACISPQPWQPNEHKRVADELKISAAIVYRAIDKLIELGVFHCQKDGVVYDDNGKVLMVDEQRNLYRHISRHEPEDAE